MKNREIKFEYIFSNEDKSILKEVFTIEQIESGNVMDWFDDNPLLKGFKIISRRQYTGLKDKNGKEIYEYDILCWPKYEGTKNQTRWVVEWNGNRAAYSDWSPREDAEVIGNLFETPELLK